MCHFFEFIIDFLFGKPTSDVLPGAFNTHSSLTQALPLSDVLLSENPPLSQLNMIKASKQLRDFSLNIFAVPLPKKANQSW